MTAKVVDSWEYSTQQFYYLTAQSHQTDLAVEFCQNVSARFDSPERQQAKMAELRQKDTACCIRRLLDQAPEATSFGYFTTWSTTPVTTDSLSQGCWNKAKSSGYYLIAKQPAY
jgi:hypothetical protein